MTYDTRTYDSEITAVRLVLIAQHIIAALYSGFRAIRSTEFYLAWSLVGASGGGAVFLDKNIIVPIAPDTYGTGSAFMLNYRIGHLSNVFLLK